MINNVVFEKSVLDFLDRKNHNFQCFLPHVNFIFNDFVTKKIQKVSMVVQDILKNGIFEIKSEDVCPLLNDIEYLRGFIEKNSFGFNVNFIQSCNFIFRFISDLIYGKDISEIYGVLQEIY